DVLVDLARTLGGELHESSTETACSERFCCKRRAARCSLMRRATASPGSSNEAAVDALFGLAWGLDGTMLAGRGGMPFLAAALSSAKPIELDFCSVEERSTPFKRTVAAPVLLEIVRRGGAALGVLWTLCIDGFLGSTGDKSRSIRVRSLMASNSSSSL